MRAKTNCVLLNDAVPLKTGLVNFVVLAHKNENFIFLTPESWEVLSENTYYAHNSYVPLI